MAFPAVAMFLSDFRGSILGMKYPSDAKAAGIQHKVQL
jgi:hypothetical protein